MSLFITSLNSGSSGNCYYIGNENEAVLIDAGISCREIERRMKRLGLNIQKVKAVFISHEHSDHINGLQILSKKYQLQVYLTQGTFNSLRFMLENHLVTFLKNELPVTIGNISVTAFSKFHDAEDPCSFIIGFKEINVGVFTDIGAICKNVVHYFKQCHAAFLETNYDDEMLEKGRYPYFLKARIRGGVGHLSNKQALELFITHKPSFMSHLFLSHLSENNNCPELVEQLFHPHANEVKVIVASRYEETRVYHINNSANTSVPKPNKKFVAAQLTFQFD